MLKCKVRFWNGKEIILEKEIKAENLSELNHVALEIAKENKARYSLGEIKEIENV